MGLRCQLASSSPAQSRRANSKRPKQSVQRAFTPLMERPGTGIAKPYPSINNRRRPPATNSSVQRAGWVGNRKIC